jgi:glycosyltransferase involved in cell wall biosynthesis
MKKPNNNQLKVAIVHDYLREYGGAEMVVEDMHDIFLEAPLYTAYYNPGKLGIHKEKFKTWDIKTSWMQHIPFINKLLSPLRIIAPIVFRSFDLSRFDVVISSNNIYYSNAVQTKRSALHIGYVHTPPKMLYGYHTSYNYKKHWYTRIGGELANHFLRIWDYKINQNPNVLVANSKNVQKRIQKFYRRDSVVIHPGVDVEKYKKTKKITGEYFLALNRLVRGKGTEIIVKACTELNLPLKVAGSGPDEQDLKNIAGKSVHFLGHVTEEEKVTLLANAKAMIAATEEEDFGINVVEAQAAGTPVIAARSGGYLETVIEGKTGEFFDMPKDLSDTKEYVNKESVESLKKVLQKFSPQKYKESDCRNQAEKFSKQNFKKQILQLIEKNYPPR